MNFEQSVYTVIPTLFKESEVDLEQINKLVNFQISNGIKYIVLLGTTSETPTLGIEESEQIVNSVWEKFNDKVNIIVGIGTNNTKTTLEQGFKFRNKCHAFMVTVPYYNKPSQEGIYQHFSTVAQLLGDKPIMMYNIPSRTGVSMSPEIIANLYNSFDNIKAIKEASGSIQQTLEIKNLCDIVVLSGDDALTLPLMSVGASGVVSVASNIIPKRMLNLVNLYRNNYPNEAMELNKILYPLFKGLFVDTNPVPLKYLMTKIGLANDESVRLPLVRIQSDDVKQQLDTLLDNLNIESEQLTYA